MLHQQPAFVPKTSPQSYLGTGGTVIGGGRPLGALGSTMQPAQRGVGNTQSNQGVSVYSSMNEIQSSTSVPYGSTYSNTRGSPLFTEFTPAASSATTNMRYQQPVANHRGNVVVVVVVVIVFIVPCCCLLLL